MSAGRAWWETDWRRYVKQRRSKHSPPQYKSIYLSLIYGIHVLGHSIWKPRWHEDSPCLYGCGYIWIGSRKVQFDSSVAYTWVVWTAAHADVIQPSDRYIEADRMSRMCAVGRQFLISCLIGSHFFRFQVLQPEYTMLLVGPRDCHGAHKGYKTKWEVWETYGR